MCYFILRTFVIYEWPSIKSSTTSNVIYIISINPFWLHIVNFSMNVFCNDFNIFSNCWIFFFHFIILEENNMSIQNTLMKCLKILKIQVYFKTLNLNTSIWCLHMVLLQQVLGYRGYRCYCLACRWWFRCEKWMLASHSRYSVDWASVFIIRSFIFFSKTVSI